MSEVISLNGFATIHRKDTDLNCGLHKAAAFSPLCVFSLPYPFTAKVLIREITSLRSFVDSNCQKWVCNVAKGGLYVFLLETDL